MRKITLVMGLTMALTLSSSAEMFDNHQLGLNTSTLGVGVEYSTSINDMFALRTGLNKYDYSESLEESGIDYDADLNLQTISLILDYHPFSNGFRLSGGAMHNSNELEVKAKLKNGATYEINGVNYNAAQVGSLDGKVDFNTFAPYAGIGYSSSKTKQTGFSFNTEIGVLFQGSPEAKLNAVCGSAIDAATCNQIKSDVAQEEKQLNDELSSFDMYPVVSIGIGYKF